MDMIAIPTIGASPYAVALYRTLLQSLQHTAYYIMVMDNTGCCSPAEEQIEEAGAKGIIDLVSSHGLNISEQWAMAFNQAQQIGCPRVHLFNDDIVLNTLSVPAMTVAMESNYRVGICGYDYFPERPLERAQFAGFRFVSGSYRDGGIGGFAFCVRTDCPPPDPQFEWWGGDDDWIWQIDRSEKRAAIAIGVPVRHPAPETSAIHRPELAEAKGRDHTRLLAKWGRAW